MHEEAGSAGDHLLPLELIRVAVDASSKVDLQSLVKEVVNEGAR